MTQTLEEKTLEEPKFDGKIAKEIRLKAGFSRRILSRELLKKALGKIPLEHDLPRGFLTPDLLIYNFEHGKPNKYPKRSETAMLYLNWLKEKGYNPYNL